MRVGGLLPYVVVVMLLQVQLAASFELVGITFDITKQPLEKAVARLNASSGKEHIVAQYPETLSTLQSAFDADNGIL